MNNGRVEFSQLCTGSVRGYSFNLVDVGIGTPINSMEQILIAQLEDTVRELECCSGRRIARIYIGKTLIPRRRAPGGGFVPFSSMNPNTWRMRGISSRWRSHHSQDYGRDGLVVLCAVTRDNVHEESTMSQEQLALAIEQRLLHYYRLTNPDPRFVNDTFTTGHLAQHSYHAYAVYMAFRYEEASGASTSSPQLTTTPPRAARAVRSQQQESDQTAQPSSLPTMSQPAPSYMPLHAYAVYVVEENDEFPNEEAHDQPHDLTGEADEDSLLGPASPIDGSPIDDTLLDSPHVMEAQNNHYHLLNEMGEDTLLGEDFHPTDSPPDGSLLDTPQTHRDDPGPSHAHTTQHDSSDNESSSVVTLDESNEPQIISSDSDSDSDLVIVPERYRH